MKKGVFIKYLAVLLLLTAATVFMLASCKKKNNNDTNPPETGSKVSASTAINYAEESDFVDGRLNESNIKYSPIDMKLGKTYYVIVDIYLDSLSINGDVGDVNIVIDVSPNTVMHATVEETSLTLVKERLILDSANLILSAEIPEASTRKTYRCIVALTPLEEGEVTLEVNVSCLGVELSGTMTAKQTVKVEGEELTPSPLEYQLSSDGSYYSVVGLGQLQGGIVTVPATYQSLPVKEIGERAFYGYGALKKVTLPDGIEQIGVSAFEGCANLFHINLPDTLTDVHPTAFSGTDLRSANATVNCIGFLPKDKLTVLKINGAGNITSETLSGFTSLRILTALDGGLTADENALSDLNIVIASIHPNFADHLPKASVAYIYIKAGTEIPDDVGIGFTSLLQLTIYDGITSVGKNAFTKCNKLVKIVNNSSVVLSETVYGYDPLHLERVSLVRKGEFVYKCVTSDFGDNTRTEYLVAYVGEGENVVIPSDVSTISQGAFSNNKIMKTVFIPKNITVIGNDVFRESAIETVKFDEDSEISDFGTAFYDCPSLKSIEFPKNVTDVTGALYGSKNVETVTVNPKNETLYAEGNCVIEKATGNVVLGCKTSVIPTSPEVNEIVVQAFFNLDITSVFVPANITKLYSGSFSSCPDIEKIEIAADNPKYESVGNCIIEKESKLLLFGCKTSVIPENYGITEISANAFQRSNITSIVIPAGVKKIGDRAFSGCTSLESITLPSGLESIGKYAFSNLPKLTEIKIPNTVTIVGYNAFRNSESLTIYIQKGTNKSKWEGDWNTKASVTGADGKTVLVYFSPATYQ